MCASDIISKCPSLYATTASQPTQLNPKREASSRLSSRQLVHRCRSMTGQKEEWTEGMPGMHEVLGSIPALKGKGNVCGREILV